MTTKQTIVADLKQTLFSNKESREPTYEELGKLLVKKKWSNMLMTLYTEEPPEMTEWISYLVYQQEICPSTNRKHWQCYAEFNCQQWGGKLMKHFKFGPGVEDAADGVKLTNPQAAVDPIACAKYCQKSKTSIPGTFKTFGVAKSKGATSKLPTMPTQPTLPTVPIQPIETPAQRKLRQEAYKSDMIRWFQDRAKALKDRYELREVYGGEELWEIQTPIL